MNKINIKEETVDHHKVSVGMKLNNLTVIRVFRETQTVTIKNKTHRVRSRLMVECKCDCGDTTITSLSKFTSGHTRSCGCMTKLRKVDEFWTHCYNLAGGIIERCNDPRYNLFHRYGGRGIKCELGDIFNEDECAYSITKVPGYFKGAQLDRVDNNGNYTIHHPIHGDKVWIYHDPNTNKDYQCLGNLRWVDEKTNTHNSAITDKNISVHDIANGPTTVGGLWKMCTNNCYEFIDFEIRDIPYEMLRRKRHKENMVTQVYMFFHKDLTQEEKDHYYKLVCERYDNANKYLEHFKNRLEYNTYETINGPVTRKVSRYLKHHKKEYIDKYLADKVEREKNQK